MIPFYIPLSPPIMWFPGRMQISLNDSWSSKNCSNAWEVMGDTSLKTTVHFFFLLKWQKAVNCSYSCHSLIFFWRVSFWFLFVSCLHVLSQTSFWYISLLISLSFTSAFVYLPLHLSCMAFWHGSVSKRWVLLDRGIVVRWQVQSDRK